MKNHNYKHIAVGIIAIILAILSGFGFYETNKDKPVEEIIETTITELKEVNITDETQSIAEETIKDTEQGKDISTTETIKGTELEEQEVVDEGAIEPDAQVDQENISYDGDITGNGLNLLGAYQGLTYYSQADSRWANQLYTSTGNRTQTMKSSACGPTSASMVVSSSKGAILPTTMAQLFVSNGYRTANNGTAWSAYSFVADYFGFKDYAYTTSINTATDYLRRGYYLIASCGSGLFTTGGHYIVIYGIDGNTLKIYDPYLYSGKFNTVSRRGKVTVSGNTVYCSVNNFKSYANYKAFWCYSNDKGTGNKKTGSKYSAGSYQVTTNVLNVRSGAGTNYRIVAKLRRGSKQGIDYTVGNWGHLMNDAGWISLDYCKKITVTNTPVQTSGYSAGSWQVTASALNVRTGPGTRYRKVTTIKRGSRQGVDRVSGNWGHLMNNAGWICLDYCKRI